MNKRIRHSLLVSFLVTLCLLAAATNFAVPSAQAAVDAQTTCSGGGSVSVTGVDPTHFSNANPTTLTVVGTGFANGAVAVLSGYSSLQTTFISDTLLQAVVPAGVPAEYNGRTHDVMVYNPTDPNVNCAVLGGAVTIVKPIPDNTPEPTGTPAPTNFVRPTITVLSYGASSEVLSPGDNIDFEVTLQNLGSSTATNITATFVAGDLIPRTTGGVVAVPDLDAGATYRFFQPLRVDSDLGDEEAILNVRVSYTDQYGKAYEESFDLSFEAYQYNYSTPTPTPTLSVRPDIIIDSYATDPEKITAGDTIELSANLVNVSPETARQVSISLNIGGEAGTPTASDTLAPLTSSNARYIDELAPGESTTVTYTLAVSGDASAGLVPVNFNLSYIDNYNVTYDETESLSLRVESVPHFHIGLFEPIPQPVMVGDTFELPIEVINIGENRVNVSSVEVTSDALDITDGSIYLGPLDGGTSGTIVPQAEALEAGPAEYTVTIYYLDNFQQSQTLVETLTIEVEGDDTAPSDDSDGDSSNSRPDRNNGQNGDEAADGEMSFGQRIWRAVLGFLGVGTEATDMGAIEDMLE